MGKWNISFDLDYEGEIKHIELTIIGIFYNQEILRVADFASGQIFEWNAKKVTNVKLEPVV